MLRIACRDDIDRVWVVRDGGLTMVFRPVVMDILEIQAQAFRQLHPEEVAIIRAASGVTAANAIETYFQRWPIGCPCSVPTRLRYEFDTTPCPLHASVAEVFA